VRILFAFAGGAGHFEPLAPVARAAAAAGHAVAFACDARMAAAVERRGFAALATGDAGPPVRRPLVPADRAHEQRVLREHYGGSLRRERAAGIAARCAEWRPDVLVCDEADFGCGDAAQALGLPLAIVLVAAPGFVPPDLAMSGLVLSPFPEGYRPGPAHRFRAHDAAPSSGDAIYFTLGTIFNLESGDLFTRVLAGLGELDADVFVSVGPHLDPAELGPQPPNVRVARHVDQADVLPRCGAVVSHGGSGSVLAALAHGLPSVLLPIGADQPENADRCLALGVARVLDPVDATPEDVRAAVADLDGCRPAAALLQAEIARLPDPGAAVAALAVAALQR
jgi:UDP:flavonoid glycosyltransferase YjiC (YdhE family)